MRYEKGIKHRNILKGLVWKGSGIEWELGGGRFFGNIDQNKIKIHVADSV